MKLITVNISDKTYKKLMQKVKHNKVALAREVEKILRDSFKVSRPLYIKPDSKKYLALDTEQYQPTDEEIEDALKSSKASNPFLCPKCGDRLTTMEVYTIFGKRLRHGCYRCNIEWNHYITSGKVLDPLIKEWEKYILKTHGEIDDKCDCTICMLERSRRK